MSHALTYLGDDRSVATSHRFCTNDLLISTEQRQGYGYLCWNNSAPQECTTCGSLFSHKTHILQRISAYRTEYRVYQRTLPAQKWIDFRERISGHHTEASWTFSGRACSTFFAFMHRLHKHMGQEHADLGKFLCRESIERAQPLRYFPILHVLPQLLIR